jgi:hypothetical protein
MGYKTEITDRNKLADKRMRLDATIIPNLHVPLDFHKRANETIITDLTFIEIHRFYNRDILPERHILYLRFFNRRFIPHNLSLNDHTLSQRPYRFFQ